MPTKDTQVEKSKNETSDRLALTVPEALEILPLSKNTIYAALREGSLPSVKVGAKILIPRHALEKMFGVA